MKISRAYGEMGVNLRATYVKFLFDLKREFEPPENSDDIVDDDGIPF